MRIDTFVNALLLGIVGTTILQPLLSEQSFDAINQTPFRGQFAYLATMGFGVTFVRFSLRRFEGLSQSAFDVFLMVVFFCLTAIGFGRASWMAALSILALVSLWTSRKSFWIVSSLFLVVVLTVPVVGERVVPGGSGGISNVTLTRVTAGRSDLWGELLERGAEELSLGHGWGYTWSLTSSALFGLEGQFGAEGDGYVFPHNDFLFLFVELGILGLGLLLAQWLLLVRQVRLLSHRRASEQARYDVRVLVPVMIVMFFVQLFDNGFAIRFVAERFFIVAGLIFGLSHLRSVGRSSAVDSRSLGTSQGFVLLDE
jgi:O-antigen ligase